MGRERSVAAWDEDSLTMAVEGGMDCLRGIDPKELDYLFLLRHPLHSRSTRGHLRLHLLWS